jgi:RNA polymerase sigma-70 factor (ECF subfamily)
VGWTGNRVDRLSDEALLAGFALGDPDVSVAFVRRFQRRVYGLAVAVVRDRAAAEDVAQQTFERVWRHAPTYDARRGSVLTWICTIARNLAIDAARLRRADPIAPDDLASLLPPSSRHSPDDLAVRSDETARLRAELRALPPEQARAVVLATICGRTAQEISTFEAIPLGTAKSRVRGGLLRLRAGSDAREDR